MIISQFEVPLAVGDSREEIVAFAIGQVREAVDSENDLSVKLPLYIRPNNSPTFDGVSPDKKYIARAVVVETAKDESVDPFEKAILFKAVVFTFSFEDPEEKAKIQAAAAFGKEMIFAIKPGWTITKNTNSDWEVEGTHRARIDVLCVEALGEGSQE